MVDNSLKKTQVGSFHLRLWERDLATFRQESILLGTSASKCTLVSVWRALTRKFLYSSPLTITGWFLLRIQRESYFHQKCVQMLAYIPLLVHWPKCHDFSNSPFQCEPLRREVMNAEFSPSREQHDHVWPLATLPPFIHRECGSGFVWLKRWFKYSKNKANYQNSN